MCKFASSLLGNLCFEQKRMGGDAYIEKGVYYGALFFDFSNCLANKEVCQKAKQR